MSQRAGWYDDPENSDHLRYFDGVVWTTNTTPKAPPAPANPTTPIPQAPQSRQGGAPGYPSQQDAPPQQYGPQYGQQYGQQYEEPQYGPPQQYGPGGYASAPPAYGPSLGVKTTPDGQPLASYGQRVGAYLLDGIIAGLICLVAGGYWIYQFVQWYARYINDLLRQVDAGGTPAVDQAQVTSQATGYLLPFIIVSLVVQILYQVGFLTRFGATPGKMIVGIAVRRRDRPGPLDLVTALKRVALSVAVALVGFVPVVGGLGSLASILDLLWPLWDDKRQALHDKIAATNVVVQPRKGRRPDARP